MLALDFEIISLVHAQIELMPKLFILYTHVYMLEPCYIKTKCRNCGSLPLLLVEFTCLFDYLFEIR